MLGSLLLILENRPRVPGKPGEEQQQIVLELEETVHLHLQWAGSHTAVLIEREARDAAIGGRVLILFADGLAKAIDLDVAGELGQLVRMEQPAAVGVQRL